MAGAKVRTEVDGRPLTLSNLDKVLFPETGFTKGELIDYYLKIAPVLLPHVVDRALTRKRWPDGVEAQPFFEKNTPRGTPEWVRTVTIASPGSTKDREEVEYVVVDGLASLVWLANLAAIELHVPQWRVGPRGGVREPDLLVIDLDPGPPATIVECAEVAGLIRGVLDADGLTSYAKTSGSKGMQLYVPLQETPGERTSAYAKDIGARLARERPDLIVATMARQARAGRVYIDWSQNNTAKTTVAPYSVRGRSHPTVSTPVGWDEIEACQHPVDLVFTTTEVLDRVAEYGDLMAGLGGKTRGRLP